MSTAWKSGVVSELKFEYARSRGAGGQHVNKTESAAILRFHVASSQYLSEIQKERALRKLSNKINSEGELILREEGARERLRNKDVLIKKFLELLEKAFFVPPTRKKTRPTRSSQRERLLVKKAHGEKKQLRSKVKKDDY